MAQQRVDLWLGKSGERQHRVKNNTFFNQVLCKQKSKSLILIALVGRMAQQRVELWFG